MRKNTGTSKTTTIYGVTADNDGNLHYKETKTTHVNSPVLGAYATITSTAVVALTDGTFRKDFSITYRGGRTSYDSRTIDADLGQRMIAVFTQQYDQIAALPTGGELPRRELRKKR